MTFQEWCDKMEADHSERHRLASYLAFMRYEQSITFAQQLTSELPNPDQKGK